MTTDNSSSLTPGEEASLQPGSPWPVFRGNLCHTGQGMGSRARGILKWTYQTGGPVRSSPAISADGTLFVGSEDGCLYALNSGTGERQWAFPMEDRVARFMVDHAGRTIYFLTVNCHLYAVDAGSGQQKWVFRFGRAARFRGVNATLTAIAGVVYVKIGRELHAVDALTGHRKWNLKADRSVVGSPIAAIPTHPRSPISTSQQSPAPFPGIIYIMIGAFEVLALDPSTGERQWSFKVEVPSASGVPPRRSLLLVGPDETVYFGTDRRLPEDPGPSQTGKSQRQSPTGALYALDADTGALRWAFPTDSPIRSLPVVDAGEVYFAAGNMVYCLESREGHLQRKFQMEFDVRPLARKRSWLFAAPSPASQEPENSGSSMIRSHEAPGLHPPTTNSRKGASTTSITEHWRPNAEHLTMDSEHPTPVPGRVLYAASQEGYIHALDTAAGTRKWEFRAGGEIWSCPVFGADGHLYFGSKDWRFHRLDATTGEEKDIASLQPNIFHSPTVLLQDLLGVAARDGYLCALDTTNQTVRWSFPYGTFPNAGPPAIAGTDGLIYAKGADGRLYGLESETGAIRWAFQPSGPVFSSPAIDSDGTVYIQGGANLCALDGGTGFRKWGFHIGRSMDSSPTPGAGGMVYIGSWDDFFALDRATGSCRWAMNTQDGVDTSPAIGPDGIVYVGSYDGGLSAVDSRTGEKRWQWSQLGRINSSPAIGSDNTIYVGRWDGSVYALDGTTGAMKWSYSTGGEVHSSPAIGADSAVYIGSDDGFIYALEGASGSLRWRYETGGPVRSSPAIRADGAVYVGSGDGKIYALEGASGALLWTVQTGGPVDSSPAIGKDGAIYVGSEDGKVYAIG